MYLCGVFAQEYRSLQMSEEGPESPGAIVIAVRCLVRVVGTKLGHCRSSKFS